MFRRPADHATLIMDFGIAIHDDITHDTLACGTRMYSSPEQTRKNVKIDGRSGHDKHTQHTPHDTHTDDHPLRVCRR